MHVALSTRVWTPGTCDGKRQSAVRPRVRVRPRHRHHSGTHRRALGYLRQVDTILLRIAVHMRAL